MLTSLDDLEVGTLSPFDARAIAHLLAGDAIEVGDQRISPAASDIVRFLASAPLEDRRQIWEEYLTCALTPTESASFRAAVGAYAKPEAGDALETVLDLLGRGLWPIAIRAGGKAPIGDSWGLTRPTVRSLEETFRRVPGAGVGLLLGPAGKVMDVECDGPGGEDSFTRLMGGEVIATLGWSSTRGQHRLFRYDDRLEACGKSIIKLPCLPGLEIRVGGSGKQLQSNCPPTPGTDGKPRVWNDTKVIAELPEAAHVLLERIMSEAAPVGPPIAGRPPGRFSVWGPAPMPSSRPSPAERARAYVFAGGFPCSVAGQGGHRQLYRVAAILVDGFGLTFDQALPIFQDWNESRARPPESEKHLRRTLTDALKNNPALSRKLLYADRSS